MKVINYLYIVLFFLFITLVTGTSSIYGISRVTISNSDESMSPMYNQGDHFLLYSSAPENINTGDIVVYDNIGINIMHRVQQVVVINEQYFYRIKGDSVNNTALDYNIRDGGSLIPYDDIVGKVIYSFGKSSSVIISSISDIMMMMILSVLIISYFVIIKYMLQQIDMDSLRAINYREIFDANRTKIISIVIILLIMMQLPYFVNTQSDMEIVSVSIRDKQSGSDYINTTIDYYEYYYFLVELTVDINIGQTSLLSRISMQNGTIIQEMNIPIRDNIIGNITLTYTLSFSSIITDNYLNVELILYTDYLFYTNIISYTDTVFYRS